MTSRAARVAVASALAGLALLSGLVAYQVLNTGRSAAIDGFQRTADPSKIVLVLTIGLLDDLSEREVREDATSVTVIVRVRTRPGTSDSLGVVVPVTVSLKEPLGSRQVRDGAGRAVPDLGTYVPGTQAASP